MRTIMLGIICNQYLASIMPILDKDLPINVPYAQKDAAKALGARFDGALRSWVVPAGINTDAFTRWSKFGANIASAPAQSSLLPEPMKAGVETKANKPMTLSVFMAKVSGVIKNAFTESQWIQVEVSKFTDRSQHAYFDFIEYNEQGKEVAKAKGSLWAGNKQKLLSKFKAATGSDIQDGMKLLLKLNPDFSAQYGFSFVVEDIDPAYTLGDMEAKLKAIRESLIKDGLYALNKQVPAPGEFTRIAVISPEGAAGLADFMREADLLTESSLCQFVYYTALFQGKDAGMSISKAMSAAMRDHIKQSFDALVIIRGGGAASDLAWLNDYSIAALICKAPLPVFTGIGHQIDNTILDEVSFLRFDTPSKVSAHIAGSIVSNAEAAIGDMLSVLKDAHHTLVLMESKVEAGLTWIQTHSLKIVTQYETDIDVHLAKIKADCDNGVQLIQQKIETLVLKVIETANNETKIAGERLDNMISEVIGLSPKKTLERGYAIVRDPGGQVLSSAKKISGQHAIKIEMHDGAVEFVKQS